MDGDLELRNVIVDKSKKGAIVEPFGSGRLINSWKHDFSSLLVKMKEDKEYWFRGEEILRSISSDFGRSHYFLVNGSRSIIEQIHTYIFTNYDDTKTAEERETFFDTLGLDAKQAVSDTQEHTPKRSRLITRVKFILLERWLSENGRNEKAAELALLLMYMSTQDYLYLFKSGIDAILGDHFSGVKHDFVFYSINFFFSDSGNLFYELKLINFVPSSGIWQAKFALPKNNKKSVVASILFEVNDMLPNKGACKIEIMGKNKHYKHKLKTNALQKYYCIINSVDLDCSIGYCDTLPTW